MADSNTVTVQDPITKETREVPKSAVRFHVNQGFQVLDSRGRVSGSATSAATNNQEK